MSIKKTYIYILLFININLKRKVSFMSKKFTHFGRICVTYVLVIAIVFSFVMSSFVGLNITASATGSPNTSAFDLWNGDKPTTAECFTNGDGTAANPYQITNGAQLWYAVNNTDATKYFKVMNDIVINDTSNYENWSATTGPGTNWNPSKKFSGTFDGNQKTITGLFGAYRASAGGNGLGLFAYTGSNATIYDVIVEKAYFESIENGASSFAGGIVGNASGASNTDLNENIKIYGCVVKNSTLLGRTGAGGIVAAAYRATNVSIVNCTSIDNNLGIIATSATSASERFVAGILADYWNSSDISIVNCFTVDYPLAYQQQTGKASLVNCYVGGDVTYPFYSGTTAFGSSSGVYKLTKAQMQDSTALDDGNMDLLFKSQWNIKEEGYPTPKAYREVYRFIESDKNTEDTVYAGGTGTKYDPYLISTPAQLYKAVNNTDSTKYFKVMNDIVINDTSDFETWSKNSGFTNWYSTNKFSGTFDGNQKTISGLYGIMSEATTNNAVGLFSYVGANATIYDVIVENAYFETTNTSGTTNAGGIVGSASGTSSAKNSNVNIYGCIVKNSKIKARNAAGGVVGGAYYTENVSITNCVSIDNELSIYAPTTSDTLLVAGIVANHWNNTNLKITNCFSVGNAISGSHNNISFTNCYVDDTAVGETYKDPTKDVGKITKLDAANMIGANALTNMNLPTNSWASTESYPVPVAYKVAYAFTAGDKVIEDTVYAGGTGTKYDPYQITDAAQLFKAVNNTDSTKFFKVMNDIQINNVDSFESWTKNEDFENWNPTNKFSGTFDGNQKTITGLYGVVNYTTYGSSVGLFAYVGKDAVIYDVIVDRAYFNTANTSTGTFAGGLIGSGAGTGEGEKRNQNIEIYGCVVKNSVICAGRGAGGIVGAIYRANNISITNCASIDNTLDVYVAKTSEHFIAGIVASNWSNEGLKVTNCFTTDYSIAWKNSQITVDNSYVGGDVSTPFYADATEFGSAGVFKLTKEQMQGSTALDDGNMSLLSKSQWNIKDEGYPTPKAYRTVYSFVEGDKNTEMVIFKGTGEIDDPYQITNAAELWKAVNSTDPTKYYKVMNDIVVNDTYYFRDWDDSYDFVDWNPTAAFRGNFNGNQKTISGLFATSSIERHRGLGLFGNVGNDTNIYNVIVENAYLKHTGSNGMTFVAGIVGSAVGTNSVNTIENVNIYGCIVKNSKLINSKGAGGIIGGAYWVNNISVTNCASLDNVIEVEPGRDETYQAGIVANHWGNTNLSITNCFSTDYTIGFRNADVTVTNCYVSGNVDNPFRNEQSSGGYSEFGDASGVYKIDNALMKGDLALENMRLSSTEWTIVPDTYPMPKPYVLEKNVWDGSKDVVSFAQLEGEGTQDNPYLISNGAELWFAVNNANKNGMANDKVPYFRLKNDIQLNPIENRKNWATEAPANSWLPSGTFVGNFDGNYNTITGLYAVPTNETATGLFAAVASDSVIKNVTLDKSYIKCGAGSNESVVGGIVGKIDGKADVTLTGLAVKNTILEGRGLTGGIVGLIANSTDIVVERCVAVDNTITYVDLGNGTSGAAGLVGDIYGNASDTAVVSNSFTASNFICRRSNAARFDNVYTTNDVAKPFASESTAFSTDVKAIAIDEMKGENALTNMALDESYWAATTNSYPVVKHYMNSNDFKAEDKNLTPSDLEGSGTKNDPYKITNAAELWVAVNNTDPELYFKVMNNITINDVSEFSSWSDTYDYEDWNPSNKFVGTFDGNKKVISGLYVSYDSEKYLGLFSQVGSGAGIVNVIIENAYVSYTGTSGMTFVGGLVGRANNVNDVNIYGCVVRNSKIFNRGKGNTSEGGLVGGAYSTASGYDITLKNCYAVDNRFSGSALWQAGLISYADKTKVTLVDCFTTDSPIGYQKNNVKAENCYVSGNVDYPFAADDKGEFGKSSGVYKIENSKMKGARALANMNFKSSKWEATDGYPISKITLDSTNGTVGEIWSGSNAMEFAGGKGTEADPWQVDTPERLYRMVSSYSSSEHWFVITKDIKINDTTASDWYKSDSVRAWDNTKSFQGHVDGKGHTIYGLYIDNKGGVAGLGLFARASKNASIANINIDKCYFEGSYTKECYSSIVVGMINSKSIVKIAGCNITNAVINNAYSFGGYVGFVYDKSYVVIDYCTFQGEKVGNNYGTKKIGGIIGDAWGGSMATNCISKGIVAVGKAKVLASVYSDVGQAGSESKGVNVTVLSAEEMLGSAAKDSMTKLNWKYMKTNADGIPTAKNNVDLSTAVIQGTPGEVWSGFVASDFAGGTGTISDPYLISTPEQLYRFTLESKIRTNETPEYYKITHDIYINDVSDKNWKDNDNLNNWLASGGGASAPYFYGHVDGDYHVIYGLYSDHNTDNISFGLVPSAKGGSSFSRLGFAEGYISNPSTNEAYTAAFVGFIKAEKTHTGGNVCRPGERIPDGEYTPIKFTECFIADSFEIYANYVGGFVAGVPAGVDFVDCYSNLFISDGAKQSGAFLGYLLYAVYPDTFNNCYSVPASKWTKFSSVSLFMDAETRKKDMIEGSVNNCYYFGSSNNYFDILFYKHMHGDLAKTYMQGFDFNNTWQTVEGGTPVLKRFAGADKFSAKFDVESVVTLVSGAEEITLPNMSGIALSPLTLPVPEREGYVFNGWYVYEEGNWEYNYGVFPVVDTILYAKWTTHSITQNFENYANTKYDFDDDYVYYRPGVAGYSSLKVHGGGKAMVRKGESADDQDFIVNANDPIPVGEEYNIRFWVATDNADTKATISLVHYTWPDFQDPNLGVEKMVEVDSLEVGKWTVYTYTFKATTPWIGIRTSGNAQLYFDDIFITPVTEVLKDPSKVNDYDYFYNLGETDKNTTSQNLSGMYAPQVNTLAPVSAVSTEETNNTIAFLVTVILAASALVVLSGVNFGNFEKEMENSVEE